MENTEELDIDIDDIGTILKSSRLKQKKSMEEISSELCIRKIYLTALEEGDYETLPPIPYGVGYVRTYARYLGLNPERAVKLYKAASIVEENSEEENKEVSEVNKSGGRHIIAGIIALALLYAGWSLYSSATEPESHENIKEDILVEDEASNESVSQVVVDEIGESSVVDPVQTVIEEEPAEELQTPSADEQTAVQEEAKTIENNKVLLEFSGESWVELKDKNKVYFQGVFHKGDKKEVDYADNLFLSVGRPHNVVVYIKGDKKNILVKRRKMNIPLDSLD